MGPGRSRTVDDGYQTWLELCSSPALVDFARRRVQGLPFAYCVDDIDKLIPCDDLISHSRRTAPESSLVTPRPPAPRSKPRTCSTRPQRRRRRIPNSSSRDESPRLHSTGLRPNVLTSPG